MCARVRWVSIGRDDSFKLSDKCAFKSERSSAMASSLWPFPAASTKWEATFPRYGMEVLLRRGARKRVIFMGEHWRETACG
jgi:hypothetical protein